MSTKITKHAIERTRERVLPLRGRQMTGYFKRAKRNGKIPSDFKDEFKAFLEEKQSKYISPRNSIPVMVKVYDNHIFIYRRTSLITVYAVPDEFMPLNDFLKPHLRKPKKKKKVDTVIKAPKKVNKNSNLVRVVSKDTRKRTPFEKELFKRIDEDYFLRYFTGFELDVLLAIYRDRKTVTNYVVERYNIPIFSKEVNQIKLKILKKMDKLKKDYNAKKNAFAEDFPKEYALLEKYGSVENIIERRIKMKHLEMTVEDFNNKKELKRRQDLTLEQKCK